MLNAVGVPPQEMTINCDALHLMKPLDQSINDAPSIIEDTETLNLLNATLDYITKIVKQ